MCKSCKQKIPSDILESIFQEQLHSFAIDEQSVVTLMQKDIHYHNSQEQLLVTTEKEITQTKKKINALFALHEQGQIATEDFKTHYEKPKNQLARLEEQKTEIEYQLRIHTSKKAFHQKIFATLQDVYGNWNTLEKTEKRNIIEAMTETITIREDEVEIVLRQLSPSFSENFTFEQHTPSGS